MNNLPYRSIYQNNALPQTTTKRILVAGAGIGGLTFIRALQNFHRLPDHHDFSIEVVERSSSFKAATGIVLHPNALRVLDSIGLLEELEPFTNLVHTIKTTKDLEDSTIRLNEVWGEENLTRTILRKDLHHLLADGITEHESLPVKMRTGFSLEHVSQKGAQAIAHFGNGETATYDLIIGADGVHSNLRQMLFPNTPALLTRLFYFRFITHNEFGIAPHTWRIFEREGASYGFIPLSENRLHCFVQLQASEIPCARGDEEGYLRNTVTAWNPLMAQALNHRCSPVHAGFAYMVPPGNWSRGSCVLVGDSAHAVSPTLSEGGALAMEDALVLSLAICAKGSIEEAIGIYEKARAQRCMWAYRMAVSQLNSIRKDRRSVQPNVNVKAGGVPAKLMAAMYRPFLDDPVPQELRAFANNRVTHLQTK